MCLYPRLLDNKKYKPTKKNNYNPPPPPTDSRVLYVPVGCGRCFECKKKKATEWRVRLSEEIRNNPNAHFATLTFSPTHLDNIKNAIKTKYKDSYEADNNACSYAIRHFLEIWRKHNKKSVKHWLITELGHQNTERIHIHGLIWTTDKTMIEKHWKYGNVFIGSYVNQRTINYISKYVTKQDPEHKEYESKIFTSKGIGKNYLERKDSFRNDFKLNETDETYKLKNGLKLNLPIYYRNKLYTEDEREQLWLYKLDKQERYVLGQKIDVSENDNEYYELLKMARMKNKTWGYGSDEKDWNRKIYEQRKRILKRLEYIKKHKEKNDDFE